MKNELESIKENGVYELVERPKDRSVIGSRWVLVQKFNADGSLARYKARVVAKGFTQRPGVDFEDTFSPTPRLTTIRLLFALAAQFDLELELMDVYTAFLNGELGEIVYVEQPEGFAEAGKEGWVWRLIKALYGLKQSPRVWNKTLDAYLRSQGFAPTKADPCVYIKTRGTFFSIILVYVDDLIMVSNDKTMMHLTKEALNR
jgi:hypothetical protein